MRKNSLFEPLIIVAAGLLSFGMQVYLLGFFQDDWNFVFFYNLGRNEGLFNFLLQDGRPGAIWIYSLGFGLLGYRPFLWQAFTIFLRIATALIFWMSLGQYWPGRRYANLCIALLFLTYPFFSLQPLSVAYAPHFASYLLLMISLYFMARAIIDPRYFVLFTAIAIISMFAHLFTVEYFIGLEFIRPIAIWFLVSKNFQISLKSRIRRTAMNWTPFLIVLTFFVVWRYTLSSSLGIRNNPLDNLIESGNTFSLVLNNALADLVLMLAYSWTKIFDPGQFVLGSVRNYFTIGLAIITALGFYYSWKLYDPGPDKAGSQNYLLLVGIFATIIGLIASYSAGYIIHLKNPPWNSRLALPVLPGLSMIIYAVMERLISFGKNRHALMSILIGLIVASQNQNTLDFKNAWEKQDRFYQQLWWRAPSIAPGTALIAGEEILGYMGDYPLSFAINSFYGGRSSASVPIWFYALSENFDFDAKKVFDSDQLYSDRASIVFTGSPNDAIFIRYLPENHECLWVLRPEYAEYKLLDENMKIGALNSNISRIENTPSDPTTYDQIINENKQSWCYYFQKAELARQYKDWTGISWLWDEAITNGVSPDSGLEFLPFIEAYAHLGEWDKAYDLTVRSNTKISGMYLLLCPAWERLASETPSHITKEEFIEKAYNKLGCASSQ